MILSHDKINAILCYRIVLKFLGRLRALLRYTRVSKALVKFLKEISFISPPPAVSSPFPSPPSPSFRSVSPFSLSYPILVIDLFRACVTETLIFFLVTSLPIHPLPTYFFRCVSRSRKPSLPLLPLRIFQVLNLKSFSYLCKSSVRDPIFLGFFNFSLTLLFIFLFSLVYPSVFLIILPPLIFLCPPRSRRLALRLFSLFPTSF